MFATPPANACRYAAANPTPFDVAYLGNPTPHQRCYELDLGEFWLNLTRQGNQVEAEFVSRGKYTPQSTNPAHDMAVHLCCQRLTVLLTVPPKTSDLDAIGQATCLYYPALSWAITQAYYHSHGIPAEPKPAFVK